MSFHSKNVHASTRAVASPAEASSLSKLEGDLASLQRVRNRLAASADEALPRILINLLPRLLSRLDENTRLLFTGTDQVRLLRQKIHHHLSGILTHALERVRGNKYMSVPWIRSVLPTLGMPSPLAITFALSLLQTAIPREDALIPNRAPLLSVVDALHQKLAMEGKESDFVNWKTSSWILLDAIAIFVGIEPLVDWDIDHSDVSTTMVERIISTTESVVPIEDVQAAGSATAGVFHLFLDLLLFWPDSRHRTTFHSGISPKGRQRMNHRLKGDSWHEANLTFLRHLKLACLRYAVWPDGQGLFQDSEKALVLCVLTATGNSMHGRLAADFLNKRHGSGSLQKQGSAFQTTSVHCSVAVACSLLILVLGDKDASVVTDKYPEERSWEAVIGELASHSAMQRPPLSATEADRAIEYILEHRLSPEAFRNKRDGIRLLLDLAGRVQKQRGSENGFSGFILVNDIRKQLGVDRGETKEQSAGSEWMKQLDQRCLEASIEVVSTVVQDTEPRRTRLNVGGARPGGVPEPFGNRRDLRHLLTEHRSSLKLRNMGTERSTVARKSAYETITALANEAIIAVEADRLSFELPILLFKCAVTDQYMEEYIAKALDEFLVVSKSAVKQFAFFHGNAALQHQVAPLLPSLLRAAASDSTACRFAAAMWAIELLSMADMPAACHLCLCLRDDPDPTVTKLIKEAKTRLDFPPSRPATAPMVFIDGTCESELEAVRRDLGGRISSVASGFGFSPQVASVLLYDFNFSVEGIKRALEEDYNAVLDRCGLAYTCTTTCATQEAMEDSEATVCNICYEEKGQASDLFSMSCNHKFCVDCWHSFVCGKFEGSRDLLFTVTCPKHDCDERLCQDTIEALLPHLSEKWQNMFLSSFIEKDPDYRFCPGPDCTMVVIADPDAKRVAKCTQCCTEFCFSCGEAPHLPARCDDFVQWNQSIGTSTFWIKKNSKPCPGCNVNIEKNQGCNHMKCTKCGADFCWLCLATLNTHMEPHNCNRYNPFTGDEDDAEKLAVFFMERFQAHEDGEIFAMRQAESIDDKANKLADRIWLFSDENLDILRQASDALVRARRFLKHSYIAAYGLRKEHKKKHVFETHQATLEQFTETLSHLMEANLEHLYVERGERSMRLHFRSMTYHTLSVMSYMERVASMV